MAVSEALETRQDPRREWRDFRLLWGGQSISMVGDQILLLALPLTAAHRLGATTMEVAALAAAARLPFLLIGLPAGVWVARIGLRRTMIGSDVVRGLAVVSVPLAGLAGVLTLPQLMLAAVLVGVCRVFFQVAYQSYTPLLISDDTRLHTADARLTLSESLSLLLGPGLAGVLIGVAGAVMSMFADAATYAVSTITLASIRHREDPVPARTRRPVWREVRDGLRFVASQPLLRPLMTAGLLYNLGYSMYLALMAVFAVDDLHLDPRVFGLALALGGAGHPLGNLLGRQLARRFGIGPTIGMTTVPIVLGLALFVSAHGHDAAVMIAVGGFVNTVGSGAFATNALTMRHLTTPAAMSTRATAVHRFVTWGVMPVGSTIAGVIGGTFGLRAAMVTAACVSATCAIPLLSRPIRQATDLSRSE